ncbi:MAG: hypothetical protein U0V73_06920 [Acidimicrobiia bacterium]
MADETITPEEPISPEESARLETVRARRHDLHAVMVALEDTLAAPAAGRPDVWAKDVYGALAELRESLALHVETTEGPGGLWEQVLDHAPRLANAVKWLQKDHAELAGLVDEAMTRTQASGGADDVEEIRVQALAVLGAFSRHRHRGADLVYEAYNVDISTGD